MLAPWGKSPLPENFSPEEDGTHDAALSGTASPTYYLPLALGSDAILESKAR